MLDRFVKIVDHELEDRPDLVFGVSRVVSKSCILNNVNIVASLVREPIGFTHPLPSFEDQTSKIH